VHHYDIAIKKEDKIVADYFRSTRERGEDCGLKHGNHNDILIEIKGFGIERLHIVPDEVFFNLITGEVFGLFRIHYCKMRASPKPRKTI